MELENGIDGRNDNERAGGTILVPNRKPFN